MEKVQFYNRYTGEVEEEAIYGEGFLRFVYGDPLGRSLNWALVKRAFFSRWYGWRMNQPKSRQKVIPFIEEFGLNPEEFVVEPEGFKSFNDFFSRALKPEARPIDDDPQSLVFPADGRHFVSPDVSKMDGIFIKGQKFDIGGLLGDEDLAERYSRGSFLLSRLCPTDYHRFHFPSGGVPGETRELSGPLCSVNPIALSNNLSILWTNKRAVTSLRTSYFGTLQIIEVGATCVGSIVQTSKPDAIVFKGDEKGYFRFGGSSTITLFEPDTVVFAEDLLSNSQNRMETYARMGDRCGHSAIPTGGSREDSH